MSNNKVPDFLVTLCVELVVSWMKTCVAATATNSVPEMSTRSWKIIVVSSLSKPVFVRPSDLIETSTCSRPLPC